MPIVYIVTNQINAHQYIGITRRTLHLRRREHLSAARTGIRACPIHRAIKKYGHENFEFCEIFASDDVDEIKRKEVKLIAQMRPHYNCTAGGDGNTGRAWSAESRAIIGAAKRGNTYRLGSTHTPEVKERLRAAGRATKHISLANLEKAHEAARKKVVCLTDGTIHVSASAAARHYKVWKSSVIEVCLKKPKRITAGGHRFEYVGASCQE